MRLVTTIFFTIFCLDTFCQSAQWQTVNEKSIKGYVVQDSVTTWQSRDSISKGKSSYVYNFPPGSAWRRVKAYGDSAGVPIAFYTPVNYVTAPENFVSISNAEFHTTSLTWTTASEKNVNYYLLQKTRNGYTSQVTKYKAKGSSNYTYRMARTLYQYSYKITAIFKDGSPGTAIIFE